MPRRTLPAQMTNAAVDQDNELRELIAARRAADPEAWDARLTPRSRGRSELYQYPAMMVSAMQGTLLEAVVQHRGGRSAVFDPFVGSGTTLVEAMRLGCAFVGCDINPMAVLLCHVNSGESADLDLVGAIGRVARRARADRRPAAERGPWVGKWFRPDVADGLSALRRAIRSEPDVRVRRVLWVSLAEVVRTSGNMLLSTPKLQTRPTVELGRAIDPSSSFVTTAQAAAAEIHRQLADLGPVERAEVRVSRSDTRHHRWPEGAEPAGVLITSPPYGDNHTTMPYGQQSFLPLRFIDTADVDPDLDLSLLATSQTLDTHSLGGSRVIDEDRVAIVAQRSETLGALLEALVDRREPWQRVAAFFVDLDEAFASALVSCADDAHLILTLGDRTVAGRRVANATIISELLSSRGSRTVTSYERSIHRNKRMARRNEFAATIDTETVLIMRRCAT